MMDSNADYASNDYYVPTALLQHVVPRYIDPNQFASPVEKAATATGLPEWAIVGAAVALAALAVLAVVK